MKPIYHHLTTRLLLCLAALLTVTACQDDYIEKNAGTAGEGDKTTLRLIVPMTRTTSEATDKDLEGNEGYIRNLWLLAYPVVDGEGETLVQKLTPKDNALTHTYQPFDIQIKLGTYHMYVVANVDETFNSDTEEKDLQGIILKYRSGENGITLPNLTAGLPMVCEYQDIKLEADGKSVGETNNGNVEIQFGQQTTVYADLTFVCVKVRYTLVFDNSTGGASSAFGTNNIVRIDGIQAVKIPKEAPLLIHPNGKNEKDLITTDGTATGTPVSYSLPFGEYHINENPDIIFNKDYTAYDELNYSQDETYYRSSHAPSYAYRGTLYLPEHYVTAATQENQTELRISATLLTKSETDGSYAERASLKYTIELGDTQDQDDQTNEADKVRQLPRGRYYDIIARITTAGDELEMTAAVKDWTLETVTAELNGPYFLQVEKTEGVEVTAGQSTVVNCSTDAPTLKCESPTYTLNGKEIEIYKVKFNTEAGEYTSFTVTVNPEMPAVENASSNDAIKKYIYIVANDQLKKKINITPVLDPYLVVTPSNYTVYMKEVANQESYSVPFTYETNLKNIKITKDEVTDHTHIDYSFAFEEEPKVYDWGTSVDFPEGIGTLTCKLKETHNQQSFPENELITFTYEATGTVLKTNGATEEKTITKRTTLQIIPNATTYRLYFRPINDDWIEPHIYVYEPLSTASDITGTYGNDNVEPQPNELIFVSNDGENALLYSYTGKVTFNGWSTHGGSVIFGNDGNVWKSDSNLCWDGLNVGDNDDNSNYNYTIDYCPTFRSGTVCSQCNKPDIKHKWPGVGMKKSETYEGWYYYDLPLLAEPGKALVMFADGHNGPQNWNKDTETQKRRYPSHMTPGIPLYNFADKEGWFAYDYTKGDDNEFVDDKPYIAPSTIYKYKIWTYQDNATNIHLWKDDDGDWTYGTKWGGSPLNITEEGKCILLTSESRIDYTIKYKLTEVYGDNTNEVKGETPITIDDWQEIDEHNFQYGYRRTFPVPSKFRIWVDYNSSNYKYSQIHLWNSSNTPLYTSYGSSDENLIQDGDKKYYDFQTSDTWSFTGDLNYKFINDDKDYSILNSKWVQVTGKDYDYEVYL